MVFRLLIILLSFNSAVFAQTITPSGSVNRNLSALEFTVDPAGQTASSLLGSPSYFLDQEFGIHAFSFYLSGSVTQLTVTESRPGSLEIPFSGSYINEDQSFDGSPVNEKAKPVLKSVANFPLFSLKPAGTINGKELTLLVVRPWIVKSGKLILLDHIGFSSENSVVPVSESQITSFVRPPINQKFKINASASAGGFDKHQSKSYRLIITKTGIASIKASELLEFDRNSTISSVDSRTIRLYNRGTEIPMLMYDGGDNRFSGDDYFEFFCEEQLYNYKNPKKDLYYDPYTNENVYFLVYDDILTGSNRGSRLVEFSGETRDFIPITDARNLRGKSFKTSAHFEQNRLMELLSRVDTSKVYDTRDHFFWDRINLNEKKRYPFVLPGVDGSSTAEALITIALHGVTYVDVSAINFEHNINAKIGTLTKTDALSDLREGVNGWNGQHLNIVKYALSMPDLYEAVNNGLNAQIEIENSDLLFPNSQISRYFHLNWFEISYNRKYEALQNKINFRAPDGAESNYQFTIDQFSDPNVQIYKKGVGKVVNFNLESYISDIKQGTKSYRVVFQDYVVNTQTTEYLALTEVSKVKPLRIELVNASVLLDAGKVGSAKKLSLKNTERDESFVIITSDQFWTPDFATEFNPIRQYADYRESELTKRSLSNVELQNRSAQVLVTTATDIFDEFNNGLKSPYAIREFLGYAFHNWKKPPLFVLILGDASSQLYSKTDKVPTMMIQTVNWGASASDSWYAMVDGNDIIPDIHIGRIPATGYTDIINYLDKLKTYESGTIKEAANNSALFISGDEKSFIRDNDEIRLAANKSFFTNNIHILADSAGDPYFGQRTDLVRYWNDGQATINFMGHGASGAWNDRGFLDDAKAIKDFGDYKLPFVTSMTCFTGAFNAGSGLVNLSEFFVTEAKKGAIGSLASSSVGWRLNDKFLAQSIYQYLLNPLYQHLTIGEIVDLGKLSYRSRYSDFFTTPFRIPNSMIHQYNILGDPAVIINFPKYHPVPDKSEVLISGNQNLNITVSSGDITDGILSARFADSGNRDLLDQSIEIPFTSGSAAINIEVPATIKNTFSNGYLKYYVNGNSKEGNGSVRFSYGDILIRKVYGQNEPVAENGTLKFIAEIENNTPIASVYFNFSIINPVDKDKFANSNSSGNTVLYSAGFQMVKSGDLWITADSIPAQYVSQQYKISWEVRVKDTSGKEYYSVGDYFLQQLPDISVISSESTLFENTTIGIYQKNGAKLGAQIYNNSTIDVENVIVNFYKNGVNQTAPPIFNGNQVLLGSTQISLLKNSSGFAYIDVPSSFKTGDIINVSVHAYADTINGKRESTYMNNLSWPKQLLFTVFLVSTSADSTVLASNGYNITFKSTFNKNADLLISSTNNYTKTGQDLLIPVSLVNETRSAVLIEPFSTSDRPVFLNSAVLKMKPAVTKNILKNSGLYYFESRSQRWIRLADHVIDSVNLTISAPINKFGIYHVFENRDQKEPTVNVTVDGRLLKPQNIVRRQSRFSFVIQDANGLTPDPSYFTIELDGQILDNATINVPDSLPDGNQMIVSFDRVLELGNHTLKYSFADASKNTLNVEGISFITSDEESITFHGGFPNPFQNEQIFAFNINGVGATSVKLRIFTVSGRLINSFDSDQSTEIPSFVPQSPQIIYDKTPNSKGASLPADYFEIYWDGTDKDGNDVAYGVYYVKLIVKLETDKTIEKIFKSVRAPK